MPNIALPAQVSLKCPSCNQGYALPREALHQREQLFCPCCGVVCSVYASLGLAERRKVYGAVRTFLEQRLYDQQQLDNPDYSEDLALIS
jgi:hypothetical protein